MTHKKVAFTNRKSQANVNVLEFKEGTESYLDEKGYYPTKAEISMELYDSLLEADFGLDSIKPKRIGELFGVKIYIDPMLSKDAVVFKNENYE